MSVLSDLQSLSSAEEFFTYLEVPHDPEVLNVSRLHILRLVGNLLREEAAVSIESSDEEVRQRFREYLARAYDSLVAKGPIEQRLFKVHKDAVKEKPAGPTAAFVPLSTLSTELETSSDGRH